MGFITKYNKKYNFHYTKGFGYPLIEDYINEIIKIINNQNFIKNMNAIWDLRYCKLPDGDNKFNLLLQFISKAKEVAPNKGDNYKNAIIVDTYDKYVDLSNYIILADEHKLKFKANIFMDIYEPLTWFDIDTKYHNEILNSLLND